jgi:hypothetical protein
MMAVRVDLREWSRRNLHYISGWILMGLVLLALVIRELGSHALVLLGPFVPYLIITLARIRRELTR